MSTLSTIAPLKKLGFDYIKVYQSDNEHIVKNGKTLYVYLKLNSSLLDNYNHFYTKSRTNWSTMSMILFVCTKIPIKNICYKNKNKKIFSYFAYNRYFYIL